jgi:ADP-ribose pyrophosphatase YjhB (NUDIX family)
MAPGETPEGAAVREAREETGLKVRIRRRYTVVSGVKAYGAYRVHFFEAEATGGRMRSGDPDGLIHQVAWVPAQRLPDLKLSHEDQRGILTAFIGEKTDR